MASTSETKALVKRVEWHVYVEPWPTERWRATTMMAADEAQARMLAKHRKFARITKVTLWATEEKIWEG